MTDWRVGALVYVVLAFGLLALLHRNESTGKRLHAPLYQLAYVLILPILSFVMLAVGVGQIVRQKIRGRDGV